MTRSSHRAALAAAVLALATAACSDDDDPSGPDGDRVYVQVERLGNPLTSEVFFLKRDHGLHNTKNPDADALSVAEGGVDVPGKVRSFIAQFRGSAAVQNTVASVLTPDVLLVYPNRDGASAGWLSWALANGYGGRMLTDDVVDVGLIAVFSSLLDADGAFCAPGELPLCTDNVGANDKAFGGTFPYLADPTP